jgi:hypothetical protein
MNSQPETAGRLSLAFRRGLVVYNLKETELRLALQLDLESYGLGLTSGKLDLLRWTRLLGYIEGGSPRLKKMQVVLDSLKQLGLVDVNEAKGEFTLRPHLPFWSNTRGTRGAVDTANEPELTLCAVRELDEALSSVHAEKALMAGHGPTETLAVPGPVCKEDRRSELQAKITDAIERGAPAEELEMLGRDFAALANERRNFPPPEPIPVPAVAAEFSAAAKSPETLGQSVAAENSSGSSLASLALTEYKAKLAKAAENSSAEPIAGSVQTKKLHQAEAAWRWLESVDDRGDLRRESWPRDQWRELSERNPGYVLGRLKGILEDNRRRIAAKESGVIAYAYPLAVLARVARDEGQLGKCGR